MTHTGLPFSKSKDEMQALMQVALGEAPADLVVRDADLVNVYTGEIQKRMSVAVKGRWIARVSAEVRDLIGSETRVIDARGRTLAQGALAWIWARSGRTVPIPGFRNTAQVVENCRAMEFGPLTADQVLEIDRILRH